MITKDELIQLATDLYERARDEHKSSAVAMMAVALLDVYSRGSRDTYDCVDGLIPPARPKVKGH